ncbi:MAG: hypothetical protein OXF02_03105 [Simkaniaceae bacterium]|nr:hypothetical protein [Simkaniaceae bacterium]
MHPRFRTGHPKTEGTVQGSKWIVLSVLLAGDEFERVFEELLPFSPYNASQLVPESEVVVDPDVLVRAYTSYVGSLQRGEGAVLDEVLFSSLLATASDSFYAMRKGDEVLLRMSRPVIRMAPFYLRFSEERDAFMATMSGVTGFSWGLRFSYPRIYANSREGKVIEVMKEQHEPEARLMKRLIALLRRISRPACFSVEGRKIIADARLGRGCRGWIHRHPGLCKGGIRSII